MHYGDLFCNGKIDEKYLPKRYKKSGGQAICRNITAT
jgi:hypothetical protein